MKLNKYLILFSCCKIVKGYNRSAIYDFQRNKIYFIPNSLHSLLNLSGYVLNIEKLLIDFSNQKNIIYEYISFLINNELAFFYHHHHLFPPISESILFDNKLDELYIKVNKQTSYLFNQKIINDLFLMQVKRLVIIFEEYLNLNLFFKNLNETFVTNVDLQMDIKIFNKNSNFIVKLNNIPLINNIFIITTDTYKAPLPKAIISPHKLYNFIITSEKDMICNLKEFIISKKFNPFYYKKLFIDSDGSIKLNFNDPNSISHIQNNISSLLYSNVLLDFWTINNDRISICKICEYRYACGESSIPIKKNNTFIKERICLYNPFKSSWYEKK